MKRQMKGDREGEEVATRGSHPCMFTIDEAMGGCPFYWD